MVGILADLSAESDIPLPKIEERKFLEIDRDNVELNFLAFSRRQVANVP